MIEKLTHVPIVVSDQEKALKFYTEVLGFEKRADYRNPGSPRWLTVAPKGTDVELILFEGQYKLDPRAPRSEEHTSELQSPCNLVCRLLLEKKKKSE